MKQGSKKIAAILGTALLASQLFAVLPPHSIAAGSVTGTKTATDVFDHTEDSVYDVRKTAAGILPTQQQLDAAGTLVKSAGAGTKIQWNPVYGTPSLIVRDGGYLSGAASGDAETIARSWLAQNATAFGLTKADVAALKVVRNYAVPGTGLHPVTFQQTFGGIETAFGGRMIVAVNKQGKILSAAGNLARSGQLAGSYALTSADALGKAAKLLASGLNFTPKLAGTKNGWDVFAKNGLAADHYVKKAIFINGGEVRPTYRVLFMEKLNEAYEVVIDGISGEKLYQRSLVAFAGAEGSVFENYPGAATGGSQVKKSFAGDAAASPQGWVLPQKDTGLTTIGNNADAYANWSNFLVPEGTGAVRPVDAFGHFNYNFLDAWRKSQGSTTPPSYANDVNSAVTNLFYHHNLFHDFYYNLGWTEGAGNLQVQNFGKGGSEGDPVLGMAHAGALSGGAPTYTGRDNAYMLTLPDGLPAWSGMFLWEPIQAAFNAPYSDGDYDASVIYHEYTHALSTRLVAGGEALGSHQAGSMGEAWGDWYAMSYLVSHGFEQEPIVGKYVTGNNERGIRNWSLAKAPLNFGDVGFDIVGPEVHADGEIWAAILWHVREEFVKRYGAQEGVKALEQLVIDAMPISAPDPSMADMRTAILTADTERYGGKYHDALWTAFGQRGLGVNASSNGGDDTDPRPAFNHADSTRNGTLAANVINAGTGQPVEDARIIIGQFEARTTEAAKISDTGKFSLPMVEGTYDVTIQARGYGSRTIEGVKIVPGQTNAMTLKLAANLASVTNGAAVTNVSDEAESNPVKNAIDDTEASVFATNKNDAGFKGAEFTVDLAGDKAVTVSHIQVSAFKDIAKGRFATLKDFTVQTSENGTDWKTVLNGSFPAQDPRPATPDLHYKGFDLSTPVKAKFVKLIADHAQDDSTGFVQVAELQVFSERKSRVEPLPLTPEAPFNATGTIQAGNAGTGVGSLADADASLAVTQNEFVTTKNPQPASQGTDGYVVSLPQPYGDGIHNIAVKGPGDGSYDMDVYFYNKDFQLIGTIASAGADETGVIPGGTNYVYVGLYTGANIPFTLTATRPY